MAGNYRPVSLTSVPCTIMESIIKSELLTFAEGNNLINGCQHGFVRGKSCLTNLLESFEQWTRALDEGYGIDVVYLDYRKAFDTVPHKRLLLKLRNYGFTEKYIKWIENFLTGRKMRVGINNSYSRWTDILSGVPQGSVLGPLLFILYVNDLPSWITNSMRMFADDTKVWSRVSNERDTAGLQDDLNSLCNWSDQWLLKFNVEKCKVMHIGQKQHFTYYLRTGNLIQDLKLTKEERDLGVLVMDDLKSNRQCAAAVAKANSILGT